MADLKTIQARLKAELRRVQDRRDSGRLGEILVEDWLRADERLEVQPLPQDIGDKRLLLREGGKRPDFAVAFRSDGECFFVDAKLHATDGLQQFALDLSEIAEFRSAMRQLEITSLLIALVPREQVDKLFLITLDDIEAKNEFGPPGTFKLDPTDALRLFGPFTREAYDLALRRFHAEGYTGEVPPYPES